MRPPVWRISFPSSPRESVSMGGAHQLASRRRGGQADEARLKLNVDRQLRWSRIVLAALGFLSALPAGAQERYQSANVTADGRLEIRTSDGRIVLIEKESGELGIDQVAISPDRAAVGWVGTRENCCTSYSIPTRLSVYSGGQRRRFIGIDLPIWKWQFVANGRRVAFHQETVHGGFGEHYEVRDFVSGRLVAQWQPEVGRDNIRLERQSPPQWVRELTRP